jgi:hypothetical protein
MITRIWIIVYVCNEWMFHWIKINIRQTFCKILFTMNKLCFETSFEKWPLSLIFLIKVFSICILNISKELRYFFSGGRYDEVKVVWKKRVCQNTNFIIFFTFCVFDNQRIESFKIASIFKYYHFLKSPIVHMKSTRLKSPPWHKMYISSNIP